MLKPVKVIFVSFVLAMFSIGAHAQTGKTVVVIPMAGDDIMPKPFAPLAKQSPPNDDYIIGDTVIDKITGLEWQKTADSTVRNWDDAFQYCVGLAIDSITDWRLPLRAELQSIADYDVIEPAVGVPFRASTLSFFYWSASSYAAGSSDAWTVHFDDGFVSGVDKTNKFGVRCVRSTRPVGPLFQDNDNGTVTDFATGLTWQQSDAHNGFD